MKRMKRLVSIIVVMSFIVSIFGVTAGAMTLTPNISTGGIEWRLLPGETVIFGKYNDIPLRWIYIGKDSSGNELLWLTPADTNRINQKGYFADYNSGWKYAWADTHIRSWLNSTSSSFSNSYMAPTNPKGFLYQFTSGERSKIITEVKLLTSAEFSYIKDCIGVSISQTTWLMQTGDNRNQGVYVNGDGVITQGVDKLNGQYLIRPAISVSSNSLVTSTSYASTATYTVVQGKDFTVPVMTEFAGTDSSTGVKAAASTGNGYSNLSGKFTTSGVKIVTIQGNKVLFNVIPQPTDSSTATVTFS